MPKNNTDAELAASYATLIFYLNYQIRLSCACRRNNIHASTKCVEFQLFLFVYRVYLCFVL